MDVMNQWLDQLPSWGVYLIILGLTAVVYQTTFATALPLVKNIIVYVFLALGCYLLLIFHILQFPIIPSLLITIILIVVTKLRLSYSSRNNNATKSDQNG